MKKLRRSKEYPWGVYRDMVRWYGEGVTSRAGKHTSRAGKHWKIEKLR